jgi:hypothetical protein
MLARVLELQAMSDEIDLLAPLEDLDPYPDIQLMIALANQREGIVEEQTETPSLANHGEGTSTMPANAPQDLGHMATTQTNFSSVSDAIVLTREEEQSEEDEILAKCFQMLEMEEEENQKEGEAETWQEEFKGQEKDLATKFQEMIENMVTSAFEIGG